MSRAPDPSQSIRFVLTGRPNVSRAVHSIDGLETPRELVLERGQTLVIGRSSRSEAKQLQAANHNTFFDCPVISRRHAELSCVLDKSSVPQVAIIDRGSRHGTTVNGTRLISGEEFILKTGDLIKLGDAVQQGTSIHDGLLLEFTNVSSSTGSVNDNTSNASSAFRGVNLSESEDSDYEGEVGSIASPESDGGSALTSPPQCKLDLELKHPQDKPQRAGVIDLSEIDDAIVSQSLRKVSSQGADIHTRSGSNATEPIRIIDDDDDADETMFGLNAHVDKVVEVDEAVGLTNDTSFGPSYMPTQAPQVPDTSMTPADFRNNELRDAEWPHTLFDHSHHRPTLPPLPPLGSLLSLGTMPPMHPLQPFEPPQAAASAQPIESSKPLEIMSASQHPAVDSTQPAHSPSLAPAKTWNPYVSRWDIMPPEASIASSHEHASASQKRKADHFTEEDAAVTDMNFAVPVSPVLCPPRSYSSRPKKKKRAQIPDQVKSERATPRRSSLQRAASSTAQVAAGALIGAVSTIIFLSSPSSEWLVDWLS